MSYNSRSYTNFNKDRWKKMTDFKQTLLKDLMIDLQKCAKNAQSLNKLIEVIDNPSKDVSRDKVDKALAQSLKHCNITNARIIRLVSYILESSNKSAQNNVLEDIINENKGKDLQNLNSAFNDIFGGMFK